MNECELMRARTVMYKVEKDTIKSWLDEIGCRHPVGYEYNYGDRTLVLYTDRPGQLIGKQGKDVEILKAKLDAQMIGDWKVKFVEIKGGFVA